MYTSCMKERIEAGRGAVNEVVGGSGGINVALLGVGMEPESSTTYNLGLPENTGLFL